MLKLLQQFLQFFSHWDLKSLLRMIWCFNLPIMIDDHGYDGNHVNGIIDLTEKGLGVCYFGPYGLDG